MAVQAFHTLWCRGLIATAAAAAALAAIEAAAAGRPARATAKPGLSAQVASLPAAGQPPSSGRAELGQDKADAERCVECHGLQGQGAGHPNGAEARVAKLAGQRASYIAKQVQDFRSGRRKHDQMAIVARNVADEDLHDIAAWFASLPPMNSGSTASANAAQGQALFEQGDPQRGIVPCGSCHGPQGRASEGSTADAPRLAGQEWRYLDQQLRAWRDGSRSNGPTPVMNQIARSLTDNEIEALAEFLSSR